MQCNVSCRLTQKKFSLLIICLRLLLSYLLVLLLFSLLVGLVLLIHKIQIIFCNLIQNVLFIYFVSHFWHINQMFPMRNPLGYLSRFVFQLYAIHAILYYSNINRVFFPDKRRLNFTSKCAHVQLETLPVFNPFRRFQRKFEHFIERAGGLFAHCGSKRLTSCAV